jgi:hypothetical protein
VCDASLSKAPARKPRHSNRHRAESILRLISIFQRAVRPQSLCSQINAEHDGPSRSGSALVEYPVPVVSTGPLATAPVWMNVAGQRGSRPPVTAKAGEAHQWVSIRLRYVNIGHLEQVVGAAERVKKRR